jgi:hypothetical protein
LDSGAAETLYGLSDYSPGVEWIGGGISREFSLDAYEIRIIKKQSRFPVIYSCSQTSDHAAVRRAKSLLEEGDGVEVWRGLDCVFALDAPNVTQ